MATLNNESATSEHQDALTLPIAKQIFSSQTLSDDSDFAIIRQYYHPNVRFRDAIQELHGRDAFIDMTKHFMKRCSTLDVHLNDAAQNGNTIFLQWTMKMRFGKSPLTTALTTIEGATKLSLGPDGKVVEHRDYFDLWGDTLDAIPGVGKLYRRAVKLLG